MTMNNAPTTATTTTTNGEMNGPLPEKETNDDDDMEDVDDDDSVEKDPITTTNNIPRKMEPLEMGEEEEEDNANNNTSTVNDMESLLPGENGVARPAIMLGDENPPPTYCGGRIQPQPVGNMHIVFPEIYFSSLNNSWGVVGPQPWGPFWVWMIICVATHYVVQRALDLGIVSALICYGFFAVCTFRLVDVSFRDPGICFYKSIPETVSSDEARLWRWCDFCDGYQPPDGAHCPQCNICIAGYDHHCVWMGTCIGKKNYRHFIKFNMTWLLYLLYAFVWLLVIGTFIKDP
eukprot:scaffold4968_cov127-Cylindrotheca_fusiformis.AAC.7